MTGTLYIVATPIGNLDDITYRAVDTLNLVDVILCEDTRHSLKLLQHYNIKKPLKSLHEHNESKRSESVLQEIAAGKSMALISDAGTPVLSDPGTRLVAAAVQQGVPVVPIPGPNAAAAAVSTAGLHAANGFVFAGFPPEKRGERDKLYELLDPLPMLLVFYIPPHDLRARIGEFARRWPERQAVICRELTKLHEEYIKGSFTDLVKQVEETRYKGEITLVIEGRAVHKRLEYEEDELRAMVKDALLSDVSLKDMGTKEVSRLLGEQFCVPSKQIYKILLSME